MRDSVHMAKGRGPRSGPTRSSRYVPAKVIAIVGAGHVGVTYAAGLADLGHSVRVIDVDQPRLALLRKGRIWFHEPGLAELLRKGIRRGQLLFTKSYARALNDSSFVFVCVPTPTTPDGGLDDSALRSAFASIKKHSGVSRLIVVNKSTVPIGTGDAAAAIFSDSAIRVVANPEFLAEGNAVEDFFRPKRIVIGSRDPSAAAQVVELYRVLGAPIVVTDPVTAEMVKLVSNAFLATKVSFINAIARVAQQVDADMGAISRAVGLDPRIGSAHLQAGLGFGGSCLPKDIAAVEHIARKLAAPYELFAAVGAINREQRKYWIERLADHWGGVVGRKVAVLGLAFKRDTDDTRESPAVGLVAELVAQGALVRTYDPAVKMTVPGATRAATVLAAARGADAVIFATDWPEFAVVDLARLRRAMSGDVLVDGRGAVGSARALSAGFQYLGFTRGEPNRRRPPTGLVGRSFQTPAKSEVRTARISPGRGNRLTEP